MDTPCKGPLHINKISIAGAVIDLTALRENIEHAKEIGQDYVVVHFEDEEIPEEDTLHDPDA